MSQLPDWPLVNPSLSPVTCSSKLQTAAESLPRDSTLAIIVTPNEKDFPSVFSD